MQVKNVGKNALLLNMKPNHQQKVLTSESLVIHSNRWFIKKIRQVNNLYE